MASYNYTGNPPESAQLTSVNNLENNETEKIKLRIKKRIKHSDYRMTPLDYKGPYFQPDALPNNSRINEERQFPCTSTRPDEAIGNEPNSGSTSLGYIVNENMNRNRTDMNSSSSSVVYVKRPYFPENTEYNKARIIQEMPSGSPLYDQSTYRKPADSNRNEPNNESLRYNTKSNKYSDGSLTNSGSSSTTPDNSNINWNELYRYNLKHMDIGSQPLGQEEAFMHSGSHSVNPASRNQVYKNSLQNNCEYNGSQLHVATDNPFMNSRPTSTMPVSDKYINWNELYAHNLKQAAFNKNAYNSIHTSTNNHLRSVKPVASKIMKRRYRKNMNSLQGDKNSLEFIPQSPGTENNPTTGSSIFEHTANNNIHQSMYPNNLMNNVFTNKNMYESEKTVDVQPSHDDTPCLPEIQQNSLAPLLRKVNTIVNNPCSAGNDPYKLNPNDSTLWRHIDLVDKTINQSHKTVEPVLADHVDNITNNIGLSPLLSVDNIVNSPRYTVDELFEENINNSTPWRHIDVVDNYMDELHKTVEPVLADHVDNITNNIGLSPLLSINNVVNNPCSTVDELSKEKNNNSMPSRPIDTIDKNTDESYKTVDPVLADHVDNITNNIGLSPLLSIDNIVNSRCSSENVLNYKNTNNSTPCKHLDLLDKNMNESHMAVESLSSADRVDDITHNNMNQCLLNIGVDKEFMNHNSALLKHIDINNKNESQNSPVSEKSPKEYDLEEIVQETKRKGGVSIFLKDFECWNKEMMKMFLNSITELDKLDKNTLYMTMKDMIQNSNSEIDEEPKQIKLQDMPLLENDDDIQTNDENCITTKTTKKRVHDNLVDCDRLKKKILRQNEKKIINVNEKPKFSLEKIKSKIQNDRNRKSKHRSCQFCNVLFKNSTQLNLHINTIHTVISFPAPKK